MPSKKRKYNARFPAGRIKKIMQTDEEVGKVAQAVPIIISRTLELFVESLLTKAMQVTASRNAKTLSPSHVKQCILAESRFDFLRDLVKNIPDVSAAEEKEMLSEENSPTSSRFTEMNIQTRRHIKDDSNSSSSSEARLQQIPALEPIRRPHIDDRLPKLQRIETVTSSTIINPQLNTVIDLSKKSEERSSRTPNFYQETLDIQETDSKPPEKQSGVIRVNPKYGIIPQPSTSLFQIANVPRPNLEISTPKTPNDFNKPLFHLDFKKNNTSVMSPKTPITPILNIDFSKNITNPEFKVLDTAAVHVQEGTHKLPIQRQLSSHNKKRFEVNKTQTKIPSIDIDCSSSGNVEIDEDYDT